MAVQEFSTATTTAPAPLLSAPNRSDAVAVTKVAVIGAGGNIGSHLVPHLGRIAALKAVILIDRDIYEAKNLISQNIAPEDVGRPKAEVQAERLRRINPALDVQVLHAAIADVPLGWLRGRALLTGLDSRAARRYVNRAAWHLGAPCWIDAGVDGPTLRVRVNTYLPGGESACMECGWDDRDYAVLLEQTYPCQQGTAESAPTDAPASLGALAAALAVLELEKFLNPARRERVLADKQVVLDALFHQHYVTAFRRNPACRCEHRRWQLESWQPAVNLPLAKLLTAARQCVGAAPRVSTGDQFATKLACPACGAAVDLHPHLRGRLSAPQRACPKCTAPLTVSGFHVREELDESLPETLLAAPLSAFGLQPRDILTLRGATGETWVEIGREPL